MTDVNWKLLFAHWKHKFHSNLENYDLSVKTQVVEKGQRNARSQGHNYACYHDVIITSAT